MFSLEAGLRLNMKLVVFSHKVCWRSPSSRSGYSTDGGFPFHMHAISELFDATSVVVPIAPHAAVAGESPIEGHNLKIAGVSHPYGSGLARKLGMAVWTLGNLPVILRELVSADAVHAPIPGDVGTIGMVLAVLLRKHLFVRYCGNWLVQETTAERFWRWFIEKFAGGRNVMLATGGSDTAPSNVNENVRWIFSTSLTRRELDTYARERSCPDRRALRLIIACRQEREKGTGVVIESLPAIAERFPGVTLDVVGDGSALGAFRESAQRLGVEARVRFLGKLDHAGVMRALGEAHLFCYPTTASEGFPKAVLEALASGLPVITTRVSVLPQLLSGNCGVLLNQATAAEVAAGVIECVTDRARYSEMSRSAIATASRYSLESWRDSIGTELTKAWGPLAGRGPLTA